jgi:murein DD-endopeptidase MepM/ murein hydrolase activator NlpD
MIKQILVFARKSMKLTILIAVSIFLIICAVALFFKPIYAVTINGESVGYSKDKSKLQARINQYMKNGDGEQSNIAFVQVDHMPEYKMCLLKRNIVTNDEEIYEKIKQSGVVYYKYYAIMEGEEEKAYLSDFTQAEQIVTKLKEKNSDNIDKITILEMYDIELKEFAEVEATVAALYKQKIVPVKKVVTTGKVNTSTNISYKKPALNLNLIRPMSGTITSRFGAVSSRRVSRHTGLDIAASTGTKIKACAGGTVTFSGYKGSYGYMVVVNHGNGVETYYGHCSKLYVKAGQQVNQGDVIAAVGNTGNSTGPHLHLEIRLNGVAYNPQNYLY